MTQFNFEAIGTSWQIDIFDLGFHDASEVLNKIKTRIEEFDQVYSRFRDDSLISKISTKEGNYVFPNDFNNLFEIYMDLYNITHGLFTPLVGQVLSDAGYDESYSLKQKKELTSPDDLNEVLNFRFPILEVKKPAVLDFGAGGKGYLVDIISGVLEGDGITHYCVDAGGDMTHRNTESIRVGLENPFDMNQVVGICDLKNRSLCGSAGTRRRWGDFTHIINPKTLKSPTDIVAVWVVANTALVADCIATCLFFVDPRILLHKYDFEYVIIRSDRSIIKSPGFVGEIFS